jgi:hypothetical protein
MREIRLHAAVLAAKGSVRIGASPYLASTSLPKPRHVPKAESRSRIPRFRWLLVPKPSLDGPQSSPRHIHAYARRRYGARQRAGGLLIDRARCCRGRAADCGRWIAAGEARVSRGPCRDSADRDTLPPFVCWSPCRGLQSMRRNVSSPENRHDVWRKLFAAGGVKSTR